MAKAKLGLMAGVGPNLTETFKRILSFGIPTCQLHCGSEHVDETFNPTQVKAAIAETGMEISAITAGFDGQHYDNVNGPATLGLVPPGLRPARVALM
ncbi:MAG: hypothetical protein NTU88_12735, partial [Armatimonadetes bacterium]|nr:hypothetical protein [Armatimonadota bacterium]